MKTAFTARPKVAARPGSAAGLQTKMRVGPSDDAYEQEADRVADQVLSPQATSGTLTTGLQAPLNIQRQHIDPNSAIHEAPSAVDAALSASGRPLDAETRSYFEPRFGHDFSRVRVHVDEAAADSVQAHAFTAGERIVFAANQYRLDTHVGQRLLAHELTHVVQQHGHAPINVQRKDDDSGKQPLLIDTAKIDAVWFNFVRQQAARMKLSIDHPKVRAAANALTVRHIGPTNFERWKTEIDPDRLTMEPATGDAVWDRLAAEREAEAKEKVRKSMMLPNGVPWSPAADHGYHVDEAEKLAKRTLSLQRDVADMERDALKLKTPEGLQGKIYQYGGGLSGMLISPTLGTASKLMSLPVQKIILKIQGKSGGPSVGSIVEESVSDEVTAYQLTAGELNEIYLDTRTHYDAFIGAVSDLNNSRNELKEARDLKEQTAAIVKFKAARKRLVEEYTAYAMGCELAGIPAKAKDLEKLAEDTAEGVVFGLVTAVPVPGGGSSKQARALLKQGVKALEEAGVTTGKEIAKDTAKALPTIGKQVGKDTTPAAKEAVKDTATKPSVAKPAVAGEKKVLEQAVPVSRYPTPARQRLATALQEEQLNASRPRSVGAAAKDANAPKPLPARRPPSKPAQKVKSPVAEKGSTPEKSTVGPDAPKPKAVEKPRTPADEFADFEKMLAEEFGAKGPITSDKLLQLYRHGSRPTVVKYLKLDLKKQAAAKGVMTVGDMSMKVKPGVALDKQVDDFVKSLEGAHSTPQSVGKKLPKDVQKALPEGKYNPDDYLVTLTEKPTHTVMDQPWKDAFDNIRKLGKKEATGKRIFDEIANGIRKTPGMSASEKASRVARLHDEMFVELGLKLDLKYPIPRIFHWWEILASKAKGK